MKNRLDYIEARLQTFIEQSVDFVLGKDRQGMLAKKLTEAMHHSMEANSTVELATQNYTILIPPDELHEWSANQDWLNLLAANILQAALEAGIPMTGTPLIHIEADDYLLPGEIIIRTGSRNAPSPLGRTAIMETPLSPQDEPPDARPENAFLIVDGGSIFPLRLHVINIGRRLDNHLILDDQRISRTHAQLRAAKGHYTLFDLSSSGGTFINGQRIYQQTLRPGDVISLAGVTIIYGEENSTNISETGEYDSSQSPQSSEDMDNIL